MTIHYLDASAWVKRHVQEAGSDWLHLFWRRRPRVACSSIGWLEVLAAIARRAPKTQSGIDALSTQIRADARGFYEVSVSPAVLAKAQDLICRHRLRCADAIHLAAALEVAEALHEPVCVIASDLELLAASAAEGLETLNPQANPPLPC